tara:strand:+ start:800 stop:1687 length:888 start_codon:yes stop_codon:yes gene_type:complete
MGCSSKVLSEVETRELEQALADGFETYTSKGGEEMLIDVSQHSPNPLFGSFVKVRMPDALRQDQSEDGNSEPDSESWEDYLEESQVEDAPRWHETNPFNFHLKGIRAYFARRVEELRDEIQNGPSPDWWENPFERMSDPSQPPFELVEFNETITQEIRSQSKAWFEVTIHEQFEQLDFIIEQSNLHRASKFHFDCCLMLVGQIGRMVEHYRWRFRYESDALRGKKSLTSASAGGKVKAKSASLMRRSILLKMEEYSAKGHSISSSARLAFQAGHGRSQEANRKLWQRHKRKSSIP